MPFLLRPLCSIDKLAVCLRERQPFFVAPHCAYEKEASSYSQRLTPPPPLSSLSLFLQNQFEKDSRPLSAPSPHPQWCLAGEYTFIFFSLTTFRATFMHFFDWFLPGFLLCICSTTQFAFLVFFFFFCARFCWQTSNFSPVLLDISIMRDCCYSFFSFSHFFLKLCGLCSKGKAAFFFFFFFGESLSLWRSEVIWKAAARVWQWRRKDKQERWEDGWSGFI